MKTAQYPTISQTSYPGAHPNRPARHAPRRRIFDSRRRAVPTSVDNYYSPRSSATGQIYRIQQSPTTTLSFRASHAGGGWTRYTPRVGLGRGRGLRSRGEVIGGVRPVNFRVVSGQARQGDLPPPPPPQQYVQKSPAEQQGVAMFW